MTLAERIFDAGIEGYYFKPHLMLKQLVVELGPPSTMGDTGYREQILLVARDLEEKNTMIGMIDD